MFWQHGEARHDILKHIIVVGILIPPHGEGILTSILQASMALIICTTEHVACFHPFIHHHCGLSYVIGMGDVCTSPHQCNSNCFSLVWNQALVVCNFSTLLDINIPNILKHCLVSLVGCVFIGRSTPVPSPVAPCCKMDFDGRFSPTLCFWFPSMDE